MPFLSKYMAMRPEDEDMLNNADALQDSNDATMPPRANPQIVPTGSQGAATSNQVAPHKGPFQRLSDKIHEYTQEQPAPTRTIHDIDPQTGKPIDTTVSGEPGPSKLRKFMNYLAPIIFTMSGGAGLVPGLAAGALVSDARKRADEKQFNTNIAQEEKAAQGNQKLFQTTAEKAKDRQNRLDVAHIMAGSRQATEKPALLNQLFQLKTQRDTLAKQNPNSPLLKSMDYQITSLENVLGANKPNKNTMSFKDYAAFRLKNPTMLEHINKPSLEDLKKEYDELYGNQETAEGMNVPQKKVSAADFDQ